jgi:hypothetical protein
MRAREFTINVPITISINGDEDPVISTPTQDQEPDQDLQQNPVMVSPQQQELELKKAELGKASPVIDKLTQDHSVGEEPPEQNDILQRLKSLLAR